MLGRGRRRRSEARDDGCDVMICAFGEDFGGLGAALVAREVILQETAARYLELETFLMLSVDSFMSSSHRWLASFIGTR